MHATHELLSVNMAPVVSLKCYYCMLLLPQELGNNHISLMEYKIVWLLIYM